MRTVRRMVWRELLTSIGFVTIAFLALFSFIDLVSELRWVDASNPQGYQIRHAVFYVATLSVSTLYELLPITVLIGAVFVMARMAQSSEYTVLRTSGLDPRRALRMMLGVGMAFTVITFLVGDFLAPAADRTGQLVRSKYTGLITVGQTGAWLREKAPDASYAVNVGAMLPDGSMHNVRIFAFDPQGRLRSTTEARSARATPAGPWELENIQRTTFANADNGAKVQAQRSAEPQGRWDTTLTAEMVSVALLRPDRMSTIDLFQYMRHLEANNQSSQRYEIEFWRKLFYPMSCLVMVVLALPFAYLHFRSGGISTFVFVGVMTGISFFLLNNLFGHFGNLRNWWPWLTAAAPGMIYSLLSLSAFGWLVLRR
jgi:lipopolysaccharide export system permease protein